MLVPILTVSYSGDATKLLWYLRSHVARGDRVVSNRYFVPEQKDQTVPLVSLSVAMKRPLQLAPSSCVSGNMQAGCACTASSQCTSLWCEDGICQSMAAPAVLVCAVYVYLS